MEPTLIYLISPKAQSYISVVAGRSLLNDVTELLFKTSLPAPPERSKMAAVVERVDGCVGSLDADAVSPRQFSPPPDQPHQNNPLLGLPIVAIETVLHFLSYDEISLLRSVRPPTGRLEGEQS